MFVDYEYYTDVFGGTDVSETEFNRYAKIACKKVSANTMSRVTDSTINSFPQELVSNIKDCVCTMCEQIKKFEDAKNRLLGVDGVQSSGILRSQTAGAVSVTYQDTSSYLSSLLDTKKQDEILSDTVKTYLSATCIDGKMYNLLSKVLKRSEEKLCSLML